MRLSTKGRYGVRALVELALAEGEGPVTLRVVAERQGLSEHYLEQLAGRLRRAGLVHSVRGAQGGYVLGRPAREITVGDILRTLEGPLALTDCSRDDGTPVKHCGRADGCSARGVWSRVRAGIEKVVDSITLADLCADVRAGGEGDEMLV